MSRSRSSRLTRLVAATCALTFVAAACGGDDDAADVTTTVVETTTTVEPETETTEPAPETTETETTEPAPETTEPDTTEPEPEPEPEITSIIDVATEAGGFDILLAAVDAAGLTDELSTRDLTVLAPTDEAFEALGQETIDALLADPEALRVVLLNHVLPLPQTAADIALFNNVLALGGASWEVNAGDPYMIGEATVIAADIEADNGIIHAIDTVLVVPEADEAG
jgi:transforming growth factor-beta-induced protein